MVRIARYDAPMATDTAMRDGSAGLRHLMRFVVAHAVAVACGGVALAMTAAVMVLADRVTPEAAAAGPALSLFTTIGGALFMIFMSIVVGSIFALPASLVAYPLALLAVRRGLRGRRLLALGAAAGLVIGLPLLVVALGVGDLPRLWADLPGMAWGAATSFGPAAAVAGAAFARVVGRL